MSAAVVVTAARVASAQPASSVRLLDVPYIQQSEALCGGAAAAMVMRYWGATGVYAESFAPLVDASAGGIRSQVLLDDLRARGWDARAFRGDGALVRARLAAGQPVVALIEDRPGAFHFVVVVAWVNGRVIYHDPARAPFRVVAEQTFDAAWQKSDRWTMLTLPPAAGVEKTNAAVSDAPRTASPKTPCDALVDEGVRAAEAGDKTRALTVFASAADLCPESSAPLREAAGVHALDGNWAGASVAARAAVARDPRDAHAWRILATAAYVRGDREAALDAWNHVGEPRVDLITVQGLDRTRHAVATALLDVPTGTRLTARTLAAAGKRLGELPSAEVARVNYTPQSEGRANVDAVVLERPMLPTSRGSLISAGVHLLSDRELRASVVSLTGGGEAITASWRWWEHRPRIAVSVAAPSRAGVWRADVFGETQTYGEPAVSFEETRRGGAISLSNWTSSLLRWEVGAQVDAWGEDRRTVGLTAALDQRLFADRMAIRVSAAVLAGSIDATTGSLSTEWRSRARHEGIVLLARAGAGVTSTQAPLALWSGAGTGHARGPLLRAHPLLDDGRITGEVFGRRVYHGGLEARGWVRPLMKVVRLAPAVFIDAARAERRLAAGAATHVDAGIGLRVALPGTSVLRLDVAKGLRDRATALSISWTR